MTHREGHGHTRIVIRRSLTKCSHHRRTQLAQCSTGMWINEHTNTHNATSWNTHTLSHRLHPLSHLTHTHILKHSLSTSAEYGSTGDDTHSDSITSTLIRIVVLDSYSFATKFVDEVGSNTKWFFSLIIRFSEHICSLEWYEISISLMDVSHIAVSILGDVLHESLHVSISIAIVE